MKATEDHLLIFEGASAGRYPQRSCPSEQRHKNRQMASALRVAEIQAKGHKAFGFVAWHGGCVGLALTARCGDARAKPPCPRPFLSATASMRLNQLFPREAVTHSLPWFHRRCLIFSAVCHSLGSCDFIIVHSFRSPPCSPSQVVPTRRVSSTPESTVTM